jgi:hypothetical protein
MHPLAGIALAAGAFLGGRWLYRRFVPSEGQPSTPQGGPVEKLVKGKTYTTLAVITKDITQDSRWNALSANMKNEDAISQLIAATFAQSGFKVLNKPIVRNSEEMRKAIAGEPSTWVFNGQWLLDGDHVTNVIPWLAGGSFYLVPIA